MSELTPDSPTDPQWELNKNFPLYQHYLPILQKELVEIERVQFWVCAFPPVDIRFHIRGRGTQHGKLAREEKQEWLRAGGIVNYFSWHLDGFVSRPETFCGRRWRLEIEDLDFQGMRANGDAGILGSGYLDEGSGFRVQLQMPPPVTQGLLEQLRQSHDRTETWRLESLIEHCQETPENPGMRNEQIAELQKIMQAMEEQTHPHMINISFRSVNLRLEKRVTRRETIRFDIGEISFDCSEAVGTVHRIK